MLAMTLTLAFQTGLADDGPRRDELSNGVTVLTLPIPGADAVGVLTFYEVGMLHEPAGMAQSAHLLEHLVCKGRTESYRQDESFGLLQKLSPVGLAMLANAETLGDHTRYNCVVPSDKLKLALRVERERLTSLTITEAVIAQEAPRCDSEADQVERHRAGGMFKMAVSALAQSWRHGEETANLRMTDVGYAPERLEAFRAAYYRADRLTIVLVGGFDREDALALAKEELGDIAVPSEKPPAPIDWAKAPKKGTVTWDGKVSAVCLAFPPPDGIDAAVLSLWGNVVAGRLTADAELREVADAVFCSGSLWKVGPMPFLVYAASKPGVPLDKLETVLRDRWAELSEVQQADLFAVRTTKVTGMSWEAISRQAKLMPRNAGFTEEQMPVLIMANLGMQLGMRERLVGADGDRLRDVDLERLRAIVAEHLNERRMIVTQLRPTRQD